jgi:AAA+ ATPase superfamily predicted ATPase
LAHLRKLFKERPINGDPSFIRDTFVNRKTELLIGKSYLEEEPFDDNLYAIFGYSRTGKSHLAMRIAQELVEREKCFYFYLNTQNVNSAFRALHDLFRILQTELTALDPSKEQATIVSCLNSAN